MTQNRSELLSDHRKERDVIIERHIRDEKVVQGKIKEKSDLIEWESNETKTQGNKGVMSDLPTRCADGDLVNPETGNDNGSVTCVAGKRLVPDQNTLGMLDAASIQNNLVLQLLQHVVERQDRQEDRTQSIIEGQAQTVQLLKVIMTERPVSNIPSPLPERRVRFDQNTSEDTQTGNANEPRVTLATHSRNVGNDQTGTQTIYSNGFDNDVRAMESERPLNGDTGYDNTGKGYDRGSENNEDSESESSDGVGTNTSDGSDDNAHIWQTKPSRRGKRKGKRESKYVVFSDPFLSITKFDSKKLAPPFKEWYSTEYHPVTLQVGLSDKESCKRMRSHMDYAAKQAYDLAVEQYGFKLVEVCQYMHTRFKATEKLTMAALHARKMNGTESVTEYALKLEAMYGNINPTASIKKRERDLAPIFRHGIPKGLLDECNMFPYPKTLTETLEQVKHREKRWKEKQVNMPERNANVRNVQTPIAYTTAGNNNNWFQPRPRYNRSFSQPRQSYQVRNPWRNGPNGNGNPYPKNGNNGYGYGNNGNRQNMWVNRQRRNSDPTGRQSQQCQICGRNNHTAATCYHRYSGRPEPNQGSANNRIQPDNMYNGYGNPSYANVVQSSPYVAQAQAGYQTGNAMGMQRPNVTNTSMPIPGRVQPSYD